MQYRDAEGVILYTMKREAKHQITFGHWGRITDIKGAFELKQTTGDSIPFTSKFEEHQLDSLEAIEEAGLRWKFSDADVRKKPCDYISTDPMPAWIVAVFSKYRYFTVIRHADFMAEAKISDRKSLRYDRAREIATRIIHI